VDAPHELLLILVPAANWAFTIVDSVGYPQAPPSVKILVEAIRPYGETPRP